MGTNQDIIIADTVSTTNYPSINKTPLRGDACKPSLKEANTAASPYSPSSPFSEILHVGLRQVQQPSNEESARDDFASAVKAGRQFQREERYDDAILSFRKALFCKNKSISMESPSVQLTFASTLFEVGMIQSYSRYHDPLKALQVFELCLQMSRACLGGGHPSVARVLYEIGVVNEFLNEPEEALAHFSESIAILLSNSMDNHLKALWMSLSRVQTMLGQTEDAQSSFNEAERL